PPSWQNEKGSNDRPSPTVVCNTSCRPPDLTQPMRQSLPYFASPVVSKTLTTDSSLLHGRLLRWQFDTATLAHRCRRGASTPPNSAGLGAEDGRRLWNAYPVIASALRRPSPTSLCRPAVRSLPPVRPGI